MSEHQAKKGSVDLIDGIMMVMCVVMIIVFVKDWGLMGTPGQLRPSQHVAGRTVRSAKSGL